MNRLGLRTESAATQIQRPRKTRPIPRGSLAAPQAASADVAGGARSSPLVFSRLQALRDGTKMTGRWPSRAARRGVRWQPCR